MRASYTVLQTEPLIIRDSGDHTRQPTITNDIEAVVNHLIRRDLLDCIGTVAFEYIDSEGVSTRVVVVNGEFHSWT